MKKKTKTIYSAWFLAPAVIIFGLLFIIPTVISLFFSMTVWDLSSFRWVGLQNFIDFFSEYSLRIGIKNTFIYAAATCVLKVVIGLLFAVKKSCAVHHLFSQSDQYSCSGDYFQRADASFKGAL